MCGFARVVQGRQRPFANGEVICHCSSIMLPVEHRFRVQDYYRLAETGILRPEVLVELLNGMIYDMPPRGSFHCGLVRRLSRIVNAGANGRWLVSIHHPVRLDDHSEPVPDVALLRPLPSDYSDRHPGPDDVFLLIEVSDIMLGYDRAEKIPAYGRSGIAEVWIVNLNNATVEVYRDPHLTGYGSRTVLEAGDKVAPQAFPDAVVDIAELVRR
jgi:Uma2 family endonuclease